MSHERANVAYQEYLPVLTEQRNHVNVQGHRMFQVLVEDFKQRIRQRNWLPGERLPSIARLAKDLHVSIGLIREVLRSLESIGLVQIEHGRGVFVTNTDVSDGLTSHVQRRDTDLIVALAESRRILETEIAALAAERGAPDELVEIALLARQMESQAHQGAAVVDLDVQFHRQIAHAAHNLTLYHMMEYVNDLFLESRRIIACEPHMTVRVVHYHVLIAEALCDRNASQARLLMLAHMNDIVGRVVAI